MAATCPQKHFEEKKCSEISEPFDHRRTRRTITWAFWLNFFSKVAKTAFCGWIWTIWEFFFPKVVAIFHHFLTLSKNLWLLQENFRQVCQNQIFSVRRIFWRPGDIFLTVLSEMHSTCLVELFLGLFWKNCNITKVLDLITSLQRFLKKFRQPCPNCHLRVLRNSLKEKKRFERPEIFRSSSNLENETLWFLVENFQQACRNWVLQVK